MDEVAEEVLDWFHAYWEAFPGMARLIDGRHRILAANRPAQERGFLVGERCVTVGPPETHKGCLMRAMLETGQGQTQRMGPDKIRGWVPVDGHEGLFVHYTLELPSC